MADFDKVMRGLECCKVECVACPEGCPYENEDGFCGRCFQVLATDALALIREQQEQLKAQKEVLDALRKVGYPHNFQREKPWIVNYMWAITDVVKKADRLNNKIIEPPCDEPPKEVEE